MAKLHIEFERYSRDYDHAEDIQLKDKAGHLVLSFSDRYSDYTFNFDKIAYFTIDK